MCLSKLVQSNAVVDCRRFTVLLGSLLLCTTAFSQIEEVIVTAQKRAQNLQEIPISIAAFDSEALKNTGASTLQELSEFVVGAELYDDRGAGQPTWVIRGVGLADFNANNTPTAAIYYDEFYLGSNAYGGIGLYDVERVEVLKGPQGGLYGRNTSGGAVRIVSSSPEAGGEFTGDVSLSQSEWGKRSAQMATGFSITSQLALRIAGFKESGGGWQDTLATEGDDKYGDRDFSAFKISALYQLNDASEILIKYEEGKDHSETPLAYGRAMYREDQSFCDAAQSGSYDPASCLTWYNATVFGTSGGLDSGIDPARQRENGEVVMSQPINKLENDFRAINLQYRWSDDNVSLLWISAAIEYDYLQLYDYDASPLTLGTEDSVANLRSWSHELRIQSNSASDIVWLSGLVLARDTDRERRLFDATDNVFILPISGFRGFYQETDSWSAYGQAEWLFTEKLKVHGSIRYTEEDKSLSDAYLRKDEIGVLPDGVPPILVDLANAAIGAATGIEDYENESRSVALEKNWSGHVGLDYFIVDDIMAYTKITSGFKSGGFFGGLALTKDMLDPYREENTVAIELGVKATLFDKTLRANASVYHYDYKAIQGYAQDQNDALGTPMIFLDNVGDGEYKGSEIELQWRPKFAPGFEAIVGASWLEAIITESDAEFARSDGTVVSVEGRHVPNAAEFSYMASLSYERSIIGDLTLGGNTIYSWRDATYGKQHAPGQVDLAGFGVDEYGLLSARLYLRASDFSWEVFVHGANLADEEYWTVATTDGLGSFTSTAGGPKTLKIGLSYYW